jgi:hypothetical protein
MKVKTMFVLLVCLAAAPALAADPQIGTWKLNEAKSKLNPASTKNNTVIYEVAPGDSVKVTVEGTTGDGKAFKSVWTGKYDGKDYPVTGDPVSDSRAYTKVDDRTLTFSAKKDGQVNLTGKIAVAADGKSRTVTTSATDAKGQKVSGTAVYDKP